jgi:carbonic anhydrase/acetyltransferase-like protein (isoleucine patch superfamily)
MGFPAKVKRPLTEEEVASLSLFWQNYVGYTREYRNEANAE